MMVRSYGVNPKPSKPGIPDSQAVETLVTQKLHKSTAGVAPVSRVGVHAFRNEHLERRPLPSGIARKKTSVG
jgi:hypothetical protein